MYDLGKKMEKSRKQSLPLFTLRKLFVLYVLISSAASFQNSLELLQNSYKCNSVTRSTESNSWKSSLEIPIFSLISK